MEPASIRSDKVIISDVSIEGPIINCELGKGGSNIWQIKKNVEEFTESLGVGGEGGEDEPAPAPEEEGAGKPMAIEHFLLNEAGVRVSATLLGGKGVKATLPRIELSNLGTDSPEGVTVAEILNKALGALLNDLSGVIKSAGSALGDIDVQGLTSGLMEQGSGLLEGGAEGGTEAVRDAGEKIKEGAGGLMRGLRNAVGGDNE